MDNTRHNGWYNKATWRVFNDILSDIDFSDWSGDGDDLKEIVEDIVFTNQVIESKYAYNFARAFIATVDFDEIADKVKS